jgi:hypothetical protein
MNSGFAIRLCCKKFSRRNRTSCRPQKQKSSLCGLLHQAIVMMQAAKHRRLDDVVTRGQLVSVAGTLSWLDSGIPGTNEE